MFAPTAVKTQRNGAPAGPAGSQRAKPAPARWGASGSPGDASAAWHFRAIPVSTPGRVDSFLGVAPLHRPLQAKFVVGASDDALEQEADRAADQAMSMPTSITVGGPEPARGAAPAMALAPAGARLSRKCAACAAAEKQADPKEHHPLQAKSTVVLPGGAPAPASVGQVLRSPGQRLEAATRSLMEARFGEDFSDVRVHAGYGAARSARELSARAYTVGSDVVFADGEYAPGANQSQRLIAHELAHVVQQREARKPAAIMRQPAACTRTYTRASSFAGLIDLVKAAETKLEGAGVTAVDDQIKSLRSIYYGQTYSLDYDVEKSTLRNVGFETYTHSLTNSPTDPSTILDCGLFQALKASQDVKEGTRTVDFGHLIIALDSRESVLDKIPFPSGGTGTEIVTWLGDLGGGAGSLAVARTTNPAISVSTRFRGTDYGAVSNLEGDIAGFLVGSAAGATSVAAPSIPSGSHVSDALRDYLAPGKAGAAWGARAKNFLTIYGGAFDATGNLTNAAALSTSFAAKIATFACQYLASRVAAGKVTPGQLQAATDHVLPCSDEMATTFVSTLANCAKSGGTLEAKGPFPSPKPAQPGACTAVQAGSGAVNKAIQLGNKAHDWLKNAGVPGF